MKRVAIVQSNYIPWKGYFDLINMVDEFILYDDAQYTKRDWRNRNRIKTPQGLKWLTIPVQVKERYFQKICETVIADQGWKEKHWKTIARNYSKANFFKRYKENFEELYLSCDETHLSRINYRFLTSICKILGIETKLSWSMDYNICSKGKTERLIELCKKTSADAYLSGPAAKGYIDPDMFKREGIQLQFMDYSGYPEYEQLFPPFEHGTTVLDLILNQGPHAMAFMKSF